MRPHPVSRPLRPRQHRILEFIHMYRMLHGHSPTVREIAQGSGITSTSVTTYNIEQLASDGYVTRIPGIARSLQLTQTGYQVIFDHVPVIESGDVSLLLLEIHHLRERCRHLETICQANGWEATARSA
jgi:SOS-response transcriptional repressor LexA